MGWGVGVGVHVLMYMGLRGNCPFSGYEMCRHLIFSKYHTKKSMSISTTGVTCLGKMICNLYWYSVHHLCVDNLTCCCLTSSQGLSMSGGDSPEARDNIKHAITACNKNISSSYVVCCDTQGAVATACEKGMNMETLYRFLN